MLSISKYPREYYDAKKALLKLAVGDRIALDGTAVERLAEASFREMQTKFS